MTHEQRSWGDGQAFSPQGIKFFLDHRRSWVKKFYLVAESNACPRRELHLRRMMSIHHTSNREIASWFALQQDLRQNHLYLEMVRMAERKGNKRLYKDITQTVHRSEKFRDHEPYVPKMYLRGRSVGFANDNAYAIIKPIVDIWTLGLKSEEVSARVCRTLDQLERQIKRSSTLKELKHNFLRVYNRSQKRHQAAIASK